MTIPDSPTPESLYMSAYPSVPSALAEALSNKGYESLTQVQSAVIEPSLAERDLLVSAQTGSGKTVAFGLAMAGNLMGDAEKLPHANEPLALIVAPTRELAMQVARELTWLYGPAAARIATCVGGMDMRERARACVEIGQVRRAPDVIHDPGDARPGHLRPDIVEHHASEPAGMQMRQRHRDQPAARGADHRHAGQAQMVE